jgi:hypothetical protein
MIDKKDLIKELEKEFESFKEEFGFNVEFEKIISEFEFQEDILSKGFVPVVFYKYYCSFIADYFRAWHGYLNGLLVPNSHFFANQTESKIFNNEEDKEIIWGLIKKLMEFSSESSLITLERDKEKIKNFINNSYEFYISDFKPKILEILKRVNKAWTEKESL